MIKVKDGYAKLIGTTYSGSADRLLLSNGGDKAVSDFAASSHNHSASDITSGTLSVSRGGTGATSFTSGAALIGNGTGAVSTRSITSSATKDSTSLITSGGVYSALAGKMNASITSIEFNTSGGLKNYGGFIDFHFHDSNGTPLNASGEVTSDGKTPDYTSRIIEDAAGTISVNGVKFKGNKVTASGGFVGNLTGNVTGNAASATNADKLDNIDSTGFMQVISQNATWSSVENIPTNLTPGVHAIHISGKEYSSILAGNDYTGAQWQLYFHPHASYLGSIKYRYSGDNVWKTLLDSSNSSVSKDGQTLTVKINGSEQSLTNSTYNFSGVSFTSGNQNTGEHNCNNIKSNGVWYYTSNGPTTALGATTNDGALYSQAYSTSWVVQIAQDYRNGNLFTRGLNSGSWSSWRKVAYVDDTVRNAYYMRTMESDNSNWYTGWKAWFKWLDSSTLGIKITNANTDDNTDASSYKFKADLAGSADSATTATTATNLANKPSLLISGTTIAVKAGEKTSDYITVPYATKAYMVSSYEVASSADVKRRIWLDWTSKDGKVAYSDDLTYQTDIKTLFAPYLYGKITVPGGSYSWYQVQQYNSSDANPSYYDATCAIVNINSYTGWQPWIRGVDSEKGSWTIGQYTTNLHIGYIPKSNTGNGLTYRWDFGKDGSTIFPGSIKFNTILIPTSSGGSTYGVGSNGQVLKSNGSTVYWASDSNSNTWRAIQVNGTQIAGTGTGTNSVNFVSGTGVTVTGATANPNTVTMSLTASGVTAGSYGPSADVTGSNNATMSVPYITVDTYGRITSISNKTYTAKNNTYSAFTGATSSAAGSAGLVPAPSAGYQGYFLRGDGTWQAPNWLPYYNGSSSMTSADVVNTPSYIHTVSSTGGSVTTITKPAGMDNAWGIIHLHTHYGNYATQLGFGGTTGKMYFRNAYNSATFSDWATLATEKWVTDKGYVTSSGVTKVSTGTGLTGGDITSTGTISINSTYQGYISNGNTAHGWGNHADAGYAKQQTWNNFIHSGNEFTFASPAYSSYIWFNYRTASGKTDGAITGYKFGNGKGGELASIDENGVYSGAAATAKVLLTDNTSQNADSCYSESPGLRFWRFNGTGNDVGGGDGWIMSWSWNTNSVGGQLYFDDNPSKTMLIRGYNSDKTFTTWSKILHSDNYTDYVNSTNFPGINKTGTVTSVTVSGSNGLSGSGTVTTSGTITLSNAGVRSISVGTGNDSDKLAINTGGTNSTITVPYATVSSYIQGAVATNPASAYFGYDKVAWFTINSTVSGGAGYAGNNTGFPVAHNANGILWLGTHSGPYGWQLGFSGNGNIYTRCISNGSFPSTSNGGSWSKLAYSSEIPTKTSQLTNDSGFINSSPNSLEMTGVSTQKTPFIDFHHYDTVSNDYDYRIICDVKGTAGTVGKGTCRFEGTSNFKGDILTNNNNTYNLGSSSKVWKNVYATTFNGTATALLNFTTKRGETDGAVDCNAVTSNGMWYWNTNGPSTTIGADYGDGALYSIAYSDSWVAQISQGFRNGELFTRARNSGTWTSWRRLAYADGIGNGTVTVNQNSSSKGSFTLNQAGNTTINLTDYYPTTFAWTAGTTAGPTGSLTGVGMSAVSFAAIPSASQTASGIVTTGAQTFAGQKTFYNGIKVGSSSTQHSTDATKIYFGDSSFVWIGEADEDDALTIYARKYVNIKTTLDAQTYISSSTSYPGVICDSMYLKSAAYHIGTVTKLQPENSATTVTTGYGIPGVTIAQGKTRGGKRTITITNTSGFRIYVHAPHVSALFLDKGEGSCIEHGFAYIQSGVSFPYTLSTGNSLSFYVIYGYVHTQGSWSTGDFTKSNDLGGFTCSVYASRYV